MKLRNIAVLALAATAVLGVARAEDLTVKGKVVDAAGRPVAGAEVASFWTAHEGAMRPHNGATTDADGHFTLKAAFWGRPVAVLVLDKDRKTGGLFTVDKASAAREATVKLEPLVRVKGDFTSKELDHKPRWTNVLLTTPKDRAQFLQCSSQQAAFSFLVPPGTYQFWGYGTDIKDDRRELTVQADQPELDLKTIDVPATVIALHKGKAPPAWKVTDARGVKKDVTPADFKGKWVLVEFWGFW